ncbi:hypothetical protein [Streptomyces sp. NPDC052811]|uniref:hypothetical protein n=1 Tax=Streptomyces sp. NPDC052811 TaxID=3155731 RepID=UPI0034165B8C
MLLLEKIQDTHVAIVPMAGSARTVTAGRSIGEAFGPPALPDGGEKKGATT